MGRETKVGLLVGMSFIVCVAIVLSHRSERRASADVPGFEIASVLSDAPVPPVLPAPRQKPIITPQPRPAPAREARPPRHAPADLEPEDPALPRFEEAGIAGTVPGDEEARPNRDRFTRRAAPIETGRVLAMRPPVANEPLIAADATAADNEPLRLSVPRVPPRESQSAVNLPGDVPAAEEGPIIVEVPAEELRRPTPSRTHHQAASEETPAADAETYLVQSGDTLGRIAAKYYGTSRPDVIAAIVAANERVIPDPNRVVAGQKLTLPALNTGQPDVAPDSFDDEPVLVEETRMIAAPPRMERYVIRPGDTLTHIAERTYGTSTPAVLKAIVDANRDWMTSADHVVTGRELRLPDLATTPERTTVPVTQPALASMTVSRTPPAASGPGREGVDWVWYELKKGDVYTTVAAAQLGTAKRWREIAELNRDIFPDPSRIQTGRKIRVPTAPGLLATTTREGRGAL